MNDTQTEALAQTPPFVCASAEKLLVDRMTFTM